MWGDVLYLGKAGTNAGAGLAKNGGRTFFWHLQQRIGLLHARTDNCEPKHDTNDGRLCALC